MDILLPLCNSYYLMFGLCHMFCLLPWLLLGCFIKPLLSHERFVRIVCLLEMPKKKPQLCTIEIGSLHQ